MSIKKEIILVSGNKNKIKEYKQILQNSIKLNVLNLDLEEIQSVNVEEVVIEKAKKAYDIVKKPVIVEDSGLYFNTLNGFPGALIKWLYKRVSYEDINKMLHSFKDKSAYAQVIIAYYDGIVLKLFKGELDGKIVKAEGDNGFGWDPIFKINKIGKTLAQLTDEEKNNVSMRRIAINKLLTYLK